MTIISQLKYLNFRVEFEFFFYRIGPRFESFDQWCLSIKGGSKPVLNE